MSVMRIGNWDCEDRSAMMIIGAISKIVQQETTSGDILSFQTATKILARLLEDDVRPEMDWMTETMSNWKIKQG